MLVSHALTNFKRCYANHASKDHHKAAIVKAEEIKRSMSDQQPDIQQRLSKALADRITSNRQKLSSTMKTIVLCGRPNIALCGHRDSALDLERDVDVSENHGNFVALLNFRVKAGDTVLGEHLSTAARNATYTSNTIQNQIVRVLADQVSHCIIKAKDIVTAVREIDNVTATLQDVRDNIHTHAQQFLTITELLSGVGMEPSVPRRCSRQTHQSNVLADTPKESYCHTISIPVLDHLLSELRSRFGNHQKTALLGLTLVLALFGSFDSDVDDCVFRFKPLGDLYERDLLSPECLEK